MLGNGTLREQVSLRLPAVRAITLVLAALFAPVALAHGSGRPAGPGRAVPVERGGSSAREGTGGEPPGDSRDEVARVLTIERVEISGREQVSLRQIETVLHREGIVEGAEILWPEDPRVERARDRLRATGYFKRVTLRVEPVDGTTDRVVLVADLEERSSVSLEALYLGSSAMTPFRGGFSVAERNFLGRGVHVGGALIWGTLPRIERARRQQAYKVFAEAPRLGRAPLGVLGSAYIISASEPYRVGGTESDPNPDLFRAFDYTRVGGLVGLTFPLSPSLSLGVDYRFERVDALLPDDPAWIRPDEVVTPVSLDVHDGVHRLTAAHFGVVWDGRDEAFLAGRGGRFVLDLQLSSPAIGSQYEYIKLVAGGAYSFRLPWRHWLTPSLSGGQIAGGAPVFEQFYSGDLADWTPGREQALRYSTRNPIDVFGTGIDARTFGVIFGRVDLEYVWPLFRRTRTRRVYGGDLFLSAGIFSLAEDRETRRQRRDAGQRVAPIGFNANFGLRLDTALGTFNVSVGNILERTPL
jgi:outer membrane protein insertion porin family